jgi:hypothetical protein
LSSLLPEDKIAALTAAAAEALSVVPVEADPPGTFVIPRSANAAGDNTARVTILARLGPNLEPVFGPVVDGPVDPGKGGKDGVEANGGD